MAYGILATFRNEAPFIAEWLAYHMAIGFEKFLIFSNDCDDGTSEILSALEKTGRVTHIEHSVDDNLVIAEEVARKAKASGFFEAGDWVIWLDADEFLNIHVGNGRVDDLVTECGQSQGICIGWRQFGASGWDRFPGQFISDNFIACSREGVIWNNVKTFFRYDHNLERFFQHKPMMRPEFWDNGGEFLAPNGKPMKLDDQYMTAWRKDRRRGKISEGYCSFQIAQINHYAVRTRSFWERKKERGRIGKANASGAQRYSNRYFRNLNSDEAIDRSILRWEADTKRITHTLISEINRTIDYSNLLRSHYADELLMTDDEGNYMIEQREQTSENASPDQQSFDLYAKMHKDHRKEFEERNYSNKKIADAIVSLIAPTTVVDVGCGIGLLLSHFKAAGVRVKGIEGAWLKPEDAFISDDELAFHDLENPLEISERFDLCTSFEVAEHLEKDRAEGFVGDLSKLSDVVVFSAAIPGQGGKGHKNEQWQQYWAELFAHEGFVPFDPFRAAFQRDPKMLPWFQQNILLFIRDGTELAGRFDEHRTSPDVVNTILPTYHKKVVRRLRRKIRSQRR